MRTFLHLSLLALTAMSGLFSCTNNSRITDESKDLSIKVDQFEKVTTANIRGLFLVNDEVAWAGGAGGTFLRTVDGQNWTSDTIAGYTHLDFRDVHAFSADVALLLAAGEEGRILRTVDGGIAWTEVYTRLDSGIFLDGMDFHGATGYCYGDPINGKMVVVKSIDAGKTWTEISAEQIPIALPKEAGFAASGTGVIANEQMSWIATGGDSIARVLRLESGATWTGYDTPMRSEDGCGIFSIVRTENRLIAVGGCYLDSTSSERNCAISNDDGVTWQLISKNQPRAYRSCVAYSNSSNLLAACGKTGIDYCLDDGDTWIPLTDEGYYTVVLGDSIGWAVGKRGKMAKLSW